MTSGPYTRSSSDPPKSPLAVPAIRMPKDFSKENQQALFDARVVVND